MRWETFHQARFITSLMCFLVAGPLPSEHDLLTYRHMSLRTTISSRKKKQKQKGKEWLYNFVLLKVARHTQKRVPLFPMPAIFENKIFLSFHSPENKMKLQASHHSERPFLVFVTDCPGNKKRRISLPSSRHVPDRMIYILRLPR